MKRILIFAALALLVSRHSYAQESGPGSIATVKNHVKLPLRVTNTLNECYTAHGEVDAYIVRWTTPEFVSVIMYSGYDSATLARNNPQPRTFWESASGNYLPVIESASAPGKKLAKTFRMAICSASFGRNEKE